jgi:hypothetical protein
MSYVISDSGYYYGAQNIEAVSFVQKIQFLSYLNLKHPINTLRINTYQYINSKYLKRVKKLEIKLNWIWLPQLKYVFSINIKTLNNHHQAPSYCMELVNIEKKKIWWLEIT